MKKAKLQNLRMLYLLRHYFNCTYSLWKLAQDYNDQTHYTGKYGELDKTRSFEVLNGFVNECKSYKMKFNTDILKQVIDRINKINTKLGQNKINTKESLFAYVIFKYDIIKIKSLSTKLRLLNEVTKND